MWLYRKAATPPVWPPPWQDAVQDAIALLKSVTVLFADFRVFISTAAVLHRYHALSLQARTDTACAQLQPLLPAIMAHMMCRMTPLLFTVLPPTTRRRLVQPKVHYRTNRAYACTAGPPVDTGGR